MPKNPFSWPGETAGDGAGGGAPAATVGAPPAAPPAAGGGTPPAQPGTRGAPLAKPVDLNLTSPEAIAAAVRTALGLGADGTPATGLAEMVRNTVETNIKALGLDKIDRRYLVHPSELDGASVRTMLMDRRPFEDRSPAEHVVVRNALNQWLRTILFGRRIEDQALRSEFEAFHTRTLSEGTDSEGGYVVPPGFLAEVIRDAAKLSQLWQWVRRIPVGTNTGEIPRVATNATVSWGSENQDFPQGDPALGSATWNIWRMNVLVKLSRELANDSNPNIVELITSLFREKIMEERDRVVAVGTGSGQPMGIYSAAGLTEVTFAALTWANLVNLHESVDERYFSSPSTRWVFNQNVKGAIMKMVDNQGRPLIQGVNDPTDGFRPRMFGHPISIESSLPNNFVFFGDLKYYLWFDRETLGVERTTEGGEAFQKHQLWIKWWERADGKPVLPPTKPMARNRQLVLA